MESKLYVVALWGTVGLKIVLNSLALNDSHLDFYDWNWKVDDSRSRRGCAWETQNVFIYDVTPYHVGLKIVFYSLASNDSHLDFYD